ncbi:ACT domain-containing protein [Caldivirga maquilingensis]|uniref:ACT domain-containing protein n=1 Tax=Caldivirga maquilingensis (strain ATCC 700844 / DSM 13496 / JCM 10307 / IC-167) TaxID=397948 RepID=A8ME71_CALMQ|nr:ACT domain-containing protein [Caldivirga maquilingensis]ABW02077.1 ACT domain-containing protein [Caldivirga maquilingensis IC-167]
MMFHRELAMIYEASGKTIVEFIIRLNEDRPGILAAVSDVFAENGVNIINASFNRLQKMIHVIADFTNSVSSISDVENMLRKFSFVYDVMEKVLNNDAYVLATLSIPTFNNNYVLAIDHDVFENQVSEPLLNILRSMGKKDGELMLGMYGSFKASELSILQLRGLGRVQVQSAGNATIIRVCRENLSEEFSKLILSYLEGFTELFNIKTQNQGISESCLQVKVTSS